MGRPRLFDENEALEKATDVFWRRGYEGAALSELTTSMGLTATSIYAAYGSKRGLFSAVLDRYDARREKFFDWIDEGLSASEVVERAIFGIIDAMTSSKTPQGCLLVQGGISCGPASGDVPLDLARRRHNLDKRLGARFERAKVDGDLHPDFDTGRLVKFISLFWDGVAVQAAAGVSRNELDEAGTMALTAINSLIEVGRPSNINS